MTVTAITKINKGDALTLCYIKPYQGRLERLKELKSGPPPCRPHPH